MKKISVLFITLLIVVLTACTECVQCKECEQCDECQQCQECEACEVCEQCDEPMEIYEYKVIHIINDEFEALSNIEDFFEDRLDYTFVLVAPVDSVQNINGEYIVGLGLNPASNMTVSVYLNEDNTEFNISEIEIGEWITVTCNLDLESSNLDNYFFFNGTVIYLVPGPVGSLPGV